MPLRARAHDPSNENHATIRRRKRSAPNAIGVNETELIGQLSKYGLGKVQILKFSETKLKEISGTLRKGLGITGGAATVIADQMEEGSDG